MEYEKEIVENLLRNYYSLQRHPDSTFSHYYLDIAYGLKELKKQSEVLYFTIVNVFVNGMPIQDQALNDGVTTRMVNYRLNDGLEALTNIMNGDMVDEG
jgi:hypothetical protein